MKQQMTTLLDGRVILETGDITVKQVGAIVNAANSSLMGGGGVDGAIHRVGGAAIKAECRQLRKQRYPNGLPTGQAVATGAGNLPADYVIHTVGPVWHGGKQQEEANLVAAYRNSLKEAVRLGVKTIAFPAISTGIYGFPCEKAACIVFRVLQEFVCTTPLPEVIYLVFFSHSAYMCFLENYDRE
jgi:O-acetyl-ADP-ribose deacetylase (regulator of RNase III)